VPPLSPEVRLRRGMLGETSRLATFTVSPKTVYSSRRASPMLPTSTSP
jgi:hypothetical protein